MSQLRAVPSLSEAGKFALPEVEAVATLPPEALPAVVLHLAALQAAVAARFAACPAEQAERQDAAADGDDYLTTAEAAAVLKVSPKWLYRRSARLPFARKLSRRELRFSRRGLERYMAGRST